MLTRIRLFFIVVRALWDRRRGAPAHNVSRLRMRVRWADCDMNRHMNNAKYLSIMDLGRWDQMIRSGLGRLAMTQKTRGVVVDIRIRYRKELKPGARYVLDTRFDRLEGRKIWMRQRFLLGEQETVAAQADVGILFLHDGRVASKEAVQRILEELGAADLPEVDESTEPVTRLAAS